MNKCCQINFEIDETNLNFSLEQQDIGFQLDSQYGSGGTNNYNSLINKPKINGVTVVGEKLGADYKLQDLMNDIAEPEIDNIIYGG